MRQNRQGPKVVDIGSHIGGFRFRLCEGKIGSKRGGAGRGGNKEGIARPLRKRAGRRHHHYPLGCSSLFQGSCTNATHSLLPKANTHTIIDIEQTHGNPVIKKQYRQNSRTLFCFFFASNVPCAAVVLLFKEKEFLLWLTHEK